MVLKDVEDRVLSALKEGNGAAIKDLIEHQIDGFFAVLRRVHPILRMPNGPVFVTLFHDVQEVLSRPEVFTVRGYARSMDPSVGPFMLARDGTTINERDKGIMRAMLRREDLPRVRAIVARLAAAAVREGTKDGRLEVVTGLSRKVPVQLVGEYFGFPGPDLATMIRWSRATCNDMFHNYTGDAAIHAADVQACTEMKAYLTGLVAQRRAQLESDSGGDDVLTRLLKSRFPAAIEFDDERLIANTMGLLIGGVETPSAAIAKIIDQFLDRPDALAELEKAVAADDDPTIFQACWEALRFNPVNPFVARVCVSSYEIASGTPHATRVEPGTVVFPATRSAMHDERQLGDPDKFRLDRPPHHYMHMGYGLHTCLGDHVAGVMIPEVIKQLVRAWAIERADGPDGRIDFQGGPFPERFTVTLRARRAAETPRKAVHKGVGPNV